MCVSWHACVCDAHAFDGERRTDQWVSYRANRRRDQPREQLRTPQSQQRGQSLIPWLPCSFGRDCSPRGRALGQRLLSVRAPQRSPHRPPRTRLCWRQPQPASLPLRQPGPRLGDPSAPCTRELLTSSGQVTNALGAYSVPTRCLREQCTAREQPKRGRSIICAL